MDYCTFYSALVIIQTKRCVAFPFLHDFNINKGVSLFAGKMPTKMNPVTFRKLD